MLQRRLLGYTAVMASHVAKFCDHPEMIPVFNQALATLTVSSPVIPSKQPTFECSGGTDGCIYWPLDSDEPRDRLAPILPGRVGRLLNDKMPTGVAVSPAMVHGGPYPATGHPGFTAVGIPASLIRFGKLTCFDNVRPQRLPELLRDQNPTGQTWRLVDLQWSTADI